MYSSRHFHGLCFGVLSLLTLVFTAPAFAKTADNCKPAFPFKQQWLGADAAYSIPLPDGRVVWIFGDTMYGEKRIVVGDEPQMVRNSIGISQCTDQGWKLDYTIRRDSAGAPQDFFKSQKKGTWYWALDGFYYDDKLWVSLLCIRAVPVTTSAAFGFETCGTDLARVSGLERDPQHWNVEVLPFVADGVKAYPSATTVVEGEYAYLFALYEAGTRPLVATRVPLSGLDEPAKHIQYLAKDRNWKPGFDPKNAKEVMAKGSTEMTIRYQPERKQWLAVMNYPKMFSNTIILRTAPSLTGPWSEGRVIYTVPEMVKTSKQYDPDTFCYAAKEHPEFRGKDSILITYACNTTKVPKLVTNTGIYFPQVVRVPLTAEDNAEEKKTAK